MTAPLRAVIWDFDGTLVDTRRRNLGVNRSIVEGVTGQPWRSFAALQSLPAYEKAQRRAANWREFYRANFGFSDHQIDFAGTHWTPYQKADRTPTPLFPGLIETLAKIAPLPQAIVSQNARDIIEEIIRDAGVGHHFAPVIGYAEVPLARQKPAPDGLLRCLDELLLARPGSVLYVGDHETDMRFVANANRALEQSGGGLTVLTVAALYCDGVSTAGWQIEPDFTAQTPADIAKIVATLNGGQ